MISLLRIKYFQFIEQCQQEGFMTACLSNLYHCEETVPVVRALSTLRPVKEPNGDLPMIYDLGPENFRSYDLRYSLRSRREQVEHRFRLGYRSFAMVRDGMTIGDLWYVTRATSHAPQHHPHLQWFEIDLGPDDVYMFDMHVDPNERGNSLTTWFLSSVLFTLHQNGYDKAYGYFDAKNVPALWVHRLIGYKEKPHIMIRRYGLYKTAHAKE